jgi:cytochrome P450 family 4
MCDILHLRHTKIWLRPNWLFNLTKYGKDQIRLLEIIHGLTKKVIARKKQEFKSGKRNVIDIAAQNNTAKTTKVIINITYKYALRYKDNLLGDSISKVFKVSRAKLR